MGVREWLGFPSKTDTPTVTETLTGVLEKYDLVEVVPNDGDPFVIVSERGTQLADGGRNVNVTPPEMAIQELGSTSPSPFTSWSRREYNTELLGLQGLRKYDRMRRSDGTVRGTLRLFKTPVLSARWFVEPASDSVKDVKAAEFVWKCFTEYMSCSWSQTLTECMLMADFGYYMFEKVWDVRVINGQERMVLKKLAPRHPMDVQRWLYDSNGGPLAVIMFPNIPNGEDVIIPIDKLLVFSFDKEAGNIEGVSVLRSAYKHWFYKEQLYKIDAIQKERHGIGIPVIKLPPGYNRDDLRAANDLGRNLRTNERAHVVLPPFWDLIFAKLEGHVVDALQSAEHHNLEIEKNILASFLDSSKATKDEDQVMFLKATRFVADIVCDTFNAYQIPQLIDYNFARGVEYPKLKARRIGESADWRTLSFAVRNLIGSGVIRPDDKLEDALRDEMDLPRVDIATIRATATPQNPGGPPQPGGAPDPNAPQNATNNQPGQPRQGPPPDGKMGKNVGVDKSGGK